MCFVPTGSVLVKLKIATGTAAINCFQSAVPIVILGVRVVIINTALK
jgi:hypothetical protein